MQAKLEVRKIDLWSLFKLAFFIYGALGLLIGLLYAFLMLVMGGVNSAIFGSDFPRFGIISGLLGIVLIPFMAFIYGVIGSVFATIGGWIFNLVAGIAGGLRFDVDTERSTESPVLTDPEVSPE